MAPSTFPFLKLPGELRIKIYELVLGGHLLHVYKDTEPNRNKPTVFRCSKYRETWPCRQWGRKLDLALLRVCRQIYHEARTIPLTTNTFKFNEPDALKKFFLAMRIGQLKLIRSLQLEPTLLYRGEVRAWAKTQVVAFAFAGLKELIIQATLECFDSGTSHSSRWTEAFLGFRRLNLDRVKVTVEVSIIDEDTDDGEASDEEISDEECEEDMDEETEDEMEEANITERRLREVAEGLKKKLLRLE